MATVVNFHGKKCIEPGSYAATVYNPTSVVNVAEFGNVMIIDTGLALNTYKGKQFEFAGGSGVNGELAKGLKSVYEFDNYEDFLAFMGGGLVGDIAYKIFTPVDGQAGAPKLYYTRAATTTPANIAMTISSGNVLKLKCKNEGICGNGVTDVDDVPESYKSLGQKVVAQGDIVKRGGSYVSVVALDSEIGQTMEVFELVPATHASDGLLKVGYSARIVSGDTLGTYKMQILKGTFAGVDEAGEPFGAKGWEDAQPNVIAESDDCTTLGELYDWAVNDRNVLAAFEVSLASGADRETELVAVSQVLATGGTTQYLSGNEYAQVLEAIEEMDITFFLCTNLNAAESAGVNANTNGRLFTFLKQDAKYAEFMVVPGGEEDTDLFGDSNSSQSIAKYYNSSQVVTVHGAPIVLRKDQNGTKQLHSIYLAATVIGLNAGLAPQTPITFRNLGYQSYAYDLKKKEREKALQAGILHVRNVSGYWCVNQGITTLQDNKKTIANDGQSFELSIELIKSQLNKELVLEGQQRFTGMTAAQANPQSVKDFTETKLASFIASVGNDNLIISYKNVKVRAQNSDYFITYDFVPNVPVNKTFFTGNILDFSVEV